MNVLYVAHKIVDGVDTALGDTHPTGHRAHLALLVEIARNHPEVKHGLDWISEAYDAGEARGLRRFGTWVEGVFYEFYEVPIDTRKRDAARTALAKMDFAAAQEDIRAASSVAQLKAEMLKINRALYRLAAALLLNQDDEPGVS